MEELVTWGSSLALIDGIFHPAIVNRFDRTVTNEFINSERNFTINLITKKYPRCREPFTTFVFTSKYKYIFRYCYIEEKKIERDSLMRKEPIKMFELKITSTEFEKHDR